jgi:IstB-like ATP binding protein
VGGFYTATFLRRAVGRSPILLRRSHQANGGTISALRNQSTSKLLILDRSYLEKHLRIELELDPGELRGALEVEQAQGCLIRAGNDLATRERLEGQQRIIAVMDLGIKRFERLSGERDFRPSERLREEQQRAVHHVLDSRDFAINLSGAAGTSKTYLLTGRCVAACRQKRRLRFATAAALVNELLEAKQQLKLRRVPARWERYDLIAIDKVGYSQMANRGPSFSFRSSTNEPERPLSSSPRIFRLRNGPR